MKKQLLFVVLVFAGLAAVTAQQSDEMYKKARLLIYGENPVIKVATWSAKDLDSYSTYAFNFKNPFPDQQKLNAGDSRLCFNLISWEQTRRKPQSTDEFLLYLQEQKEAVDKMPISGVSGKMSGWLLVLEMAVRSGLLPVGKQ
jgi:hypothetical protein